MAFVPDSFLLPQHPPLPIQGGATRLPQSLCSHIPSPGITPPYFQTHLQHYPPFQFCFPGSALVIFIQTHVSLPTPVCLEHVLCTFCLVAIYNPASPSILGWEILKGLFIFVF